METPRWLTDEQQQAWRAFGQMNRDLGVVMERQLSQDHGLSGADYELLVPLSEAPGQRLRPRDLGMSVRWERSRLSHQLRRMQERGLIERTDCDNDARGTVIALTELGRSTIAHAAPGHVETVRKYFIDLLTEDELTVIGGAARKVIAATAASTGERLTDQPESGCS